MPWKRSSSGKGFIRLLTGGGIFFLAFLTLPATASAQSDAEKITDADDNQALVIDNTVISADAIARMHALAQRDDPGLDRQTFLDAVVESHLVADHVREQGLIDTVLDSHGVGFAPAVQIDNRQIATLRALFAEPLSQTVKALGEQGLNALLVAPLQPDSDAVAAALGSPARHVYILSREEQQAAETVTLARYRLPGNDTIYAVTLADIYQRQNVQGRIALHQGDHTWLVRETQLYIGQQFVRAWSEREAPAGAATIRAINTLVEDRMLRQAWLAHSGVSTEIHAGNPALKAESGRVSRDAIHRWYRDNQDRFRSVHAAQASVARCTEKAVCEKWLARQNAGEDKPDAWPNHESATLVIDTQWYRRDDTRDWLTDVVLMHPDSSSKAPVRGPGDTGWYLVKVTERTWQTHGVDSLTVDTVARREIARQRLVERYLGLTKRLHAKAHIERPAS